MSYRYRAWVILGTEETKISDVYAYTVTDARRRAAQRALEALLKKQPSHVKKMNLIDLMESLEFCRLLQVNQ
jgi:hypothetical protein